jgi:hypothetical protein
VEYEHKLIYEMQKRRDGWIYYPERDRSMFSDGQYVIRYLYLPKQEWIVAVEGRVSSGWSMLKGFLTPKLFLGLFVIVAAAFGLMLLSAFWHFRRVMKAILRAQENNFIASEARPLAEQSFIRREDIPFSEGVIQSVTDRSLPKARPRPVEDMEMRDTPRPELAPCQEERQPRPKPEPVFNPRQLDNLGEVSIDTMEIRSPLLKRAIEELREDKK